MIWTILSAIIIFSIIIFVHELGHFVTAKAFKVKVHEFAIGMGPALFKKRRGDTLYAIRAVPMGGYCKMEGEDEAADSPVSFNTKPCYARFIILAAGAAMNILLGFVICLGMCIFTASHGNLHIPVVDSVLENSGAYGVLQPGDKILSINGDSIHVHRDVMEKTFSPDTPVSVEVKRGGDKLSFEIMPVLMEYDNGLSRYIIGYTSQSSKNPFYVVNEAFFQTIWMVRMIFESLKMLFTGVASVNDLSGPVGVVSIMSEVARHGVADFLFLAAFIAVNIGIMNLLPIPALDGGRILFVLIEWIRRKPINPEKEGYVHFVGLVLLLALMLFATWNDVVKMITG